MLATINPICPAKEREKRAGRMLKRGKQEIRPGRRGFLNSKILKTTS